MSKLSGTTYVTLPIGTSIELYTNICPKMGEEFRVIHIDTKKVVHKARVTGFDDHSRKTPQPLRVYEVRAVIIE
jgi:hypothetical protein